ncbi:MAG: succinate dehydrogenase cytochrome b subunit [Acidimicrobiales bacterium]|nr:succinate dehydrogenase cytochrome b subunit [Acidimicrobiales bacterium]
METMEKQAVGSGVKPIHPSRRPAPWPVEFYRSAVGKKWVMALTGIVLMGFVFGHMIGNLKIYQGAHAINVYGEFLRELLYPLLPRTVPLWIVRIGLILAFAFHIHAAASLTLVNRRAGAAGGYATKRDYDAANVASRSMRWTGVIILLFLFFHLADFTWGWFNPDFVRGDIYRNVQASLTNAVPAAIYIVANIALGIHLFHGAWSMFQSLGLNNPKYNQWRRNFAVGFAAIIVVGNLSFPIGVVSGATEDDTCFEAGERIVTCEAVFADALRAGAITVQEFDQFSDSERHEIIEAYEANETLEVGSAEADE